MAWDEVIGGVRQAACAIGFDGPDAERSAPPRLGAPDATRPIRAVSTGTPSSYPMVASTSRGPLVLWVDGAPGASTIAIALLR